MNVSTSTAARLAHPAEIVAAEIDEHHVLGSLLLVLQQLLRDPLVLGDVRPARARARDRPRAHPRATVGRPAELTVSSGSGLAPATWKSPKSRKYMYGLGFTARSPR